MRLEDRGTSAQTLSLGVELPRMYGVRGAELCDIGMRFTMG